VANRRGGMSPAQRAKQFMPFAAVKGLEEALERKRRELARMEKIELSEEMSQALDEKLRGLAKGCRAAVTWYADGAYQTITGRLDRIEPAGHFLCIGNRRIDFEDLLNVEKTDEDGGEDK